ncbi:MAG: polyhydroxyalkanoate synthesis regulator DNA-binding domain-containing protein [Myxococcales bacterium]|nr:polyhydroxyalkanoate synthesis regulator DNA-binding domain-containing protein [Myxococcales bacterium]
MSEAEQTAREPKVIKRYTNRKLYDTVESRYVTLDEIADMVKQGVEVQIVDNRTKEDLTSVTLAQIVFEEEKKKNQMPLSVLREIIRRPQDSLNEITATVTQRVATFREEATNRLDKLLGREAEAEPLTPAALLTQSQKVVEAWQAKIDERVKHAIENVLGNLPALGRDLNTLVQRIEQMEKRISEIEEARRSDEPRRDEPRRGRER